MRKKNIEYYEQIVKFIDDFYEYNGHSPSIRDISAGIGVPRSTVQRYINDLKDRGDISSCGHRSILTNTVPQYKKNDYTKACLGGSIPCGQFNEYTEIQNEYVFIPKTVIGSGEFFVLKAVGESMINAGIADGDYVLIKRQSIASPKDIVAVLYRNTQTTLKRYITRETSIILHPENDELDDIVVDDPQNLVIQGIAIMVIKSVQKQ